MIVRVHRMAERNGVAVLLLAVSSAVFAALLLDDVSFEASLLPLAPDPSGTALLVAIYGTGAFGSLARRAGAGRNEEAVLEPDAVRLGRERIARADVVALSVVHAAIGSSVSITTRSSRRFVEVGGRAEAARIVAALGGLRAPPATEPRTWIPVLQSNVRGLLLFFAALHIAGPWGLASFKAVVGLAAGLMGLVATVLAFVRFAMVARGASFRDTPTGPWTLHERIHAGATDAVDVDAAPDELGPTRAWLSGVDARATAARGATYREGLPARDDLLVRVRDPDARPHERLAAARMLRVAFEVPPAEIADAVSTEPEIRARVEAVCGEDDPLRAAARLDALGPAFRAH